MDVHCTSCGEPWDVYHLRHDAIFETDLNSEEAKAWRTLPADLRLNSRYREKFQAAGWQFGRSVMNVIHCPCCPKEAMPNPDRLSTKAGLEELFGDDEDGLAAAYEDFNL
jgi:hypothetical protein